MNRILVAEDEPRIASFLEKGLRANGFAVMLVEDGEDALDLAASGRSTCSCSTWACRAGTGSRCCESSEREGRPCQSSS